MSVNVQRDAHIGMPHDILQSLDVHTRVRHVRAAGMPEHMRRDVRQRLVRMQLLILLCPAHFILDVQSGLRTVVLVQHDEAVVTVCHKIASCSEKGTAQLPGKSPEAALFVGL